MSKRKQKKFRWPFRGVLRWDDKKQAFVPVKKPQVTVAAPFVHTDELPQPLMSMADQKVYTSKAKLRASYKVPRPNAPYGYEETGGEIPKTEIPELTYEEVREDAEKAYYDLKYDRVPMTEMEKEICLREKRAFEEFKKRQR